MKLWMKLVLGIFIISVLAAGVTFSYTFYNLSKMKTTKILKTDENLGIKSEVHLKQGDTSTNEASIKEEVGSEIINIAFFGVDRRVANEPSRSDTIMIVSIDQLHKKIKISSIMRDTYVKIDKHGDTKINHAYAFGGPEMAIRTLNENFNLDIRDYVTVDFFNLEKIIDAIGGVNIDVKQNEIKLINKNMIGVAKIEKESILKVTKSQSQTLNGLQAVAYSRIRDTVGGDFARTERQRSILSAMLTKIQTLGIMKFPAVVSKALPYTETSMKGTEIIKLSSKVFTSNIMTFEQERFPVDGFCKGKTIDGVWYLVPNMKDTVEQIHKFIYDDIKVEPRSPLF